MLNAFLNPKGPSPAAGYPATASCLSHEEEQVALRKRFSVILGFGNAAVRVYQKSLKTLIVILPTPCFSQPGPLLKPVIKFRSGGRSGRDGMSVTIRFISGCWYLHLCAKAATYDPCPSSNRT